MYMSELNQAAGCTLTTSKVLEIDYTPAQHRHEVKETE